MKTNKTKRTCLEPFHRIVRLAQRAWPCILENRDPFLIVYCVFFIFYFRLIECFMRCSDVCACFENGCCCCCCCSVFFRRWLTDICNWSGILAALYGSRACTGTDYKLARQTNNSWWAGEKRLCIGGYSDGTVKGFFFGDTRVSSSSLLLLR